MIRIILIALCGLSLFLSSDASACGMRVKKEQVKKEKSKETEAQVKTPSLLTAFDAIDFMVIPEKEEKTSPKDLPPPKEKEVKKEPVKRPRS